MNIEDFVDRANPFGGIKNVSAETILMLFSEFQERGYWITRLEAFLQRDGREVPTIDYSVIGLDGTDNFEEHGDVNRHMKYVQKILTNADESGLPFIFHVWVEEIE